MTDETSLDVRLRTFLEELGGVAGSVHIVQADDLHLAAAVGLPEPVLAATTVIPRGKGMAGVAWERGEPIQTCDLVTDDSGGVIRPGARAVDARAAIALPVRDSEGEITAVVGVAFDDEREFSAMDIDRLNASAAALFQDSDGLSPPAAEHSG
jgi:putative methionine-R-sulfoxide reductase with GAF domain